MLPQAIAGLCATKDTAQDLLRNQPLGPLNKCVFDFPQLPSKFDIAPVVYHAVGQFGISNGSKLPVQAE